VPGTSCAIRQMFAVLLTTNAWTIGAVLEKPEV
jgi:hypothetical protein